MLRKNTKKLIAHFGTLLTVVLFQNSSLQAQNLPTNQVRKQIIQLETPTLRTLEAMKSDMQKNSTIAATSTPVKIRFRPSINRARFERLKSEAQAQSATARYKPSLTAANTTKLPTKGGGINCEGNSYTEKLSPPDTHGAVGLTQFVEVTNSRISVFNKSSCSPAISSVTLAAFFGYTKTVLFDPRVVYDKTWNRWIVTADSDPESTTVQRQFIAVSQTSNAAGPYYTYNLNVSYASNSYGFWDFPQLGMDQNAILITANICPNDDCSSSNLISIPKSQLYNGLTPSVAIFNKLAFGLTPPIVLDLSAKAFLVSPVDTASGTTLKLYTLVNSSNATEASLSAPVNVTVPLYTVPPAAKQPGTRITLDTSDNRFVNASTQIGNSLWQIHTVNYLGYAAPRFYEINTTTNALKQTGLIYASTTSYDWNASIAANNANQAFVTWSSTDPTGNVNAQVRAASCINNPVNTCNFGTGVALFTSSTNYLGVGLGPERWGDYSAVTIDPSSSTTAWFVNQKNNSTTSWGSRFGSIIGF